MTIPEQAVQAALDVPVVGGRENYIRSILTAAAPHLAAVRVNSDQIEAARKAVEELAHVQMNLPLEDWSRISSTILSALEPSAGRAAVLEEAARIVDGKAEEYEKEARDLRGSDRDRRFCSAVAVRLRGSANEIRALHPVADKPDEAGAQGGVKPVAYLRQEDITRLSEPTTGAISAQISSERTDWLGCTVPVFAALPTPPSGEVA